MKTTEQILNLINPISKSGKGSKHLISKLSKGAGKDFKGILTSLDISDNEKSAIIFELLKQFDGKKILNLSVTKSEILEAAKSLSGKYTKHSSKELSSEGNSNHIVKPKLLNTTTNGRQIRNLAVSEKVSSNVKSVDFTQNVSNEILSGNGKINEQEKKSILNGIIPSNPLLGGNIKKEFTLKNEKREISKVNLNKLNVLDKKIVTTNAIKKFSAQIKAAQNGSPAMTDVEKKTVFKSTKEKIRVLNSGPKFDPESLNKLVTTSAEKALSKSGNSKIITGLEQNKVLENKPENKTSGNSNSIGGRPEESIKFAKGVTPAHDKDFSKYAGKVSSLNTPGKATNSKDMLNMKNVDPDSSQRSQTGKVVLNDNSFIVKEKNLSIPQYVPGTISINESMKAFNSAGKRVNTVAVKTRKVSSSKSVNTSKRIQSNSSVINLKVVQKSYNTQSELGNFEKEYLNISNIIGEKAGNGFESSEQYDNNLSKLKTTFFSNGVALSADKMLNTHQMKLSVKMINEELSKLQLRISPKGLGIIKIDIQKEGKALYTKFVAETVEVASLLKDMLPELKETLAQQGLRLEDTQISSKEENLRQYLSEKKDNEFEEKSKDKRSSHLGDYHTEIAPELLAHKSVPILSPYSTVEYLA